jgi:hypothetical protein
MQHTYSFLRLRTKTGRFYPIANSVNWFHSIAMPSRRNAMCFSIWIELVTPFYARLPLTLSGIGCHRIKTKTRHSSFQSSHLNWRGSGGGTMIFGAESVANVNPAAHFAFDKPVASPYHATTPEILGWFDTYNEGQTREEQVVPFNFLLAFQIEPTADDPRKEINSADPRGRKKPSNAKPVAPHDQGPLKAARHCFDRETGKKIPFDDLKTYRGALAAYHLYPETKFLNDRRFSSMAQ